MDLSRGVWIMADSVKATWHVWPRLMGRVEIETASLLHPKPESKTAEDLVTASAEKAVVELAPSYNLHACAGTLSLIRPSSGLTRLQKVSADWILDDCRSSPGQALGQVHVWVSEGQAVQPSPLPDAKTWYGALWAPLAEMKGPGAISFSRPAPITALRIDYAFTPGSSPSATTTIPDLAKVSKLGGETAVPDRFNEHKPPGGNPVPGAINVRAPLSGADVPRPVHKRKSRRERKPRREADDLLKNAFDGFEHKSFEEVEASPKQSVLGKEKALPEKGLTLDELLAPKQPSPK